ncbi:MAG: ImmA/IrrE family metallo-endopeptidase [Clostridia bacterium]|nr:ImmA/IrrE family metallo-endopeptidase [Clostridia bacterium]
MIASKEVIARAKRAVEKCGTRDPFEIARMCKAELIIKELGSLKGFYKIIYRNPFIFLNKSLSAADARIVCAHEIGHHALHREYARIGFEEFSLFSENSRREYEANLFAAELLIADEDIEELCEYGYSQNQIAAALGIEEKLVELKLKYCNKI